MARGCSPSPSRASAPAPRPGRVALRRRRHCRPSRLVRPRRPWLFEAHSSFDDAVADDELLFCWTRPMSTGVYAGRRALPRRRPEGAARVPLLPARRPRPGRALLELDARLVVQPSAAARPRPGADVLAPRRVRRRAPRRLLVRARVRARFRQGGDVDGAGVCAQGVAARANNGSVGLLDAIDAGAGAGLPTAAGAPPPRARRARGHAAAASRRRGARRGDRRRAVGDDGRPRDRRGAAEVAAATTPG